MKIILVAFAGLFFFSCGGGGGGSTLPAAIPDVAGTYSITIAEAQISCTDGSFGVVPETSFNVAIAQSEKTVTVAETSLPPEEGVTVLDGSPMTGTVQSDGDFDMSASATAEINGIPGQVTVNWILSGKFKASGWSGDYTYSAAIPAYSATCKYTSTFSGSKL